MALYELRTYTLYVGKMAEATKLYQELGFPALKDGGYDKKLVGYFQADTGTINQLVHLWKFDDDADRRKHWAGVFANKEFGRLCLEVPAACHDTGGQTANGRAVGSTSVTAAALPLSQISDACPGCSAARRVYSRGHRHACVARCTADPGPQQA